MTVGCGEYRHGPAAALCKSLLVRSALHARSVATGKVLASSESILGAMRQPGIEIVLSLVMGAVIGVLFCQLIRRLSHGRDMLIIVFGTVLLTTGLCIQWHLSLILTNMVVGFVLVNSRRESLVHRATEPLLGIMPLVFVLFFCLAGAHLHIAELPALGVLGLVYVIARSAGLIGGARVGAMFGRVEDKIKKYIGLGILSQAGVAIGLSLIMRHELADLYEKHREAFDVLARNQPMYDPLTIGATVITTVTATCIVFEVIGPILTKIALTRAGEISAPR